MEWSPALFGFLGALVGATAPSLMQARGTRRLRLEDAYSDLAGASSLLLHVSIDAAFGRGTSVSDEPWVRFGAARARVLLQETDPACRRMVGDLSTSFDDLYTTRVFLQADQDSEADLVRRSQEHISKMETVKGVLENLLTAARERLRDAFIE
jgi:hypothetical protein